MGLQPQEITDVKKRLFLEEFAKDGNASRANRVVGQHNATHNAWRRTDPVFEAGYKAALRASVHALEQEAHRRAVTGVVRQIWHCGKVVGEELRYSDVLLMFLLNGAAPDKYNRKREEPTEKPARRRKTMKIKIVEDTEAASMFVAVPSNGQSAAAR